MNWGFTFYIVIGRPAKLKVRYNSKMRSVRICMGIISIKIGLYDLERWQGKVYREFIKRDNEIKKLKEENHV